jgi:phage FluMu protein Com
VTETVHCPHCNLELQNDATVAGKEVQCPGCTNLLLMPLMTARGNANPLQIRVQTIPSRHTRYGGRSRSYNGRRTTDPIAILSFAAAFGGLFLPGIMHLIPLCIVVSFVCCLISGHRLKEDPSLKGHGFLFCAFFLNMLLIVLYVLLLRYQDQIINELLNEV